MVTKRDYDAIQVEAARSVMLELVHLLGKYRDDIVVVGGWVSNEHEAKGHLRRTASFMKGYW